MSLSAVDQRDAGALIAKALDPKLRTGADPEYRELLGKYQANSYLRTLVQNVLIGMDLMILAADDLGLVVAPYRESVLAARLSDVPNANSVQNRTLFGVALLGIAAYAYPRREDLEAERPRYVTVPDVDAFLRVQCAALADGAGEADADRTATRPFREYARLAPRRPGERLGVRSSYYWVEAALNWLSESGMARRDRSDDTRWVLTERFRLHMAEVAGNAAFEALRELSQAGRTAAHAAHEDPASDTDVSTNTTTTTQTEDLS